jgi:hypothetical protein
MNLKLGEELPTTAWAVNKSLQSVASLSLFCIAVQTLMFIGLLL